jgi:hypothetical protein
MSHSLCVIWEECMTKEKYDSPNDSLSARYGKRKRNIFTVRDMDFLAVLDMILKVVVIDHVVFRFSSITPSLGRVRGLF